MSDRFEPRRNVKVPAAGSPRDASFVHCTFADVIPIRAAHEERDRMRRRDERDVLRLLVAVLAFVAGLGWMVAWGWV